MTLDGKVAIITGSGRGLGLAYAHELARRGASVLMNDVDAAVAEEAVARIESLVRAANPYLRLRVLFGSDFPLLTPDRWRADADAASLFRAEVLPGIPKDNAVRRLGIGGRV